MPMPIRVFFSGLTGNIYASRRYTERPGGLFVSHSKDDVTQEALVAACVHVEQSCTKTECACRFLELRSQCGKIYPVPVPGEVVKACSLPPRHEGQHTDGLVQWTYSPPVGATP